jgi:hypothetical protein
MRMVAMGMMKDDEQASGRPGNGNGSGFPMIASVGAVSLCMVMTMSSQQCWCGAGSRATARGGMAMRHCLQVSVPVIPSRLKGLALANMGTGMDNVMAAVSGAAAPSYACVVTKSASRSEWLRLEDNGGMGK